MTFSLSSMAGHPAAAVLLWLALSAHPAPAAAQAGPDAATECPGNAAMDACVAKAKSLVASRQYRQAADYLEAACIRGAKPACDELWPVLLNPAYGLRDGARFYSVFEASCRAGAMGSCQDGALVASGSSGAQYTNAYKDYSRVRTFGEPGCAQNRMEACYGLMMLYSNNDSPQRNLDLGIRYALKVCAIGEYSGCTIGARMFDNLPKAEVAKRAGDLYTLYSGACRAGQNDYCAGLDNIKTMAGRVGEYSPDDAFHMFMVDQGVSNNNWGGSVAYAVNEARSAAATRYAIGRASALGRMDYVTQNDLRYIQTYYAQDRAGQIARNELARRARLDGQQYTAPAEEEQGFAEAVAERNRQADRQREANRGKKLNCRVYQGEQICTYD
tara:strand:- start:2669 stop:3826 length:1158 start_codon:yes stop_codon:yes gene_type:complete